MIQSLQLHNSYHVRPNVSIKATRMSIVSLSIVVWCSSYHYHTISFNKAWFKVLLSFKFSLQCVPDLWWWESQTMVLSENKNKHLSSVNHSTKTICHHHHHHHHHHHEVWVQTPHFTSKEDLIKCEDQVESGYQLPIYFSCLYSAQFKKL